MWIRLVLFEKSFTHTISLPDQLLIPCRVKKNISSIPKLGGPVGLNAVFAILMRNLSLTVWNILATLVDDCLMPRQENWVTLNKTLLFQIKATRKDKQPNLKKLRLEN